jgi:hypothetical protein
MKSRRSSVPTRKLLLQPLEPRLALAGNVTASLIDGRLAIIGDDAANEVFVGDMGGGRFVVRGMTGTTGAPTTINGQSEVVIENVFGDVSVDLGGGNDLFYLVAESDWNGGNPFASTWQSGGFAPLLSSHGYAKVYGELKVNLGNGNDTAVITGSASAGMRIEGGLDDGDDGVFVRTAADRATSAFHLDMGQGNDYAALSMNNIVNLIAVDTLAGNDTLYMKVRTDCDLYVNTGDGDDYLAMQGQFGESGFSGASSPYVNTARNMISVQTGAGNDYLNMEMLVAQDLLVNSGAGQDAIFVQGIAIRNDATVQGGGASGSRITITDYNKRDLGSIDHSGAYLAETYIATQIDGKLTVNFSYDYLDSPGPIADRWYSVTVGVEYANSEHHKRGFVVGEGIHIFGTVESDRFLISPLNTSSLHIDGGWGQDEISGRGIDVAGDVTLLLGDGDDYGLKVSDYTYSAYINDVWTDTRIYTPTHIGGNLRVDLGAGNETNDGGGFIAPTPGTPLPFNPFAVGAGNSGLTTNFVVDGALTVIGGGGEDEFAVVAAKLGSANIQFDGERSNLDMHVFLIDGNLSVSGGAGLDYWLLDAFGVGGDILLSSGGWRDSISLNHQMSLASHANGRLHIDAGSGDDEVEIGLSSTNQMLVRQEVVIEGGEGHDMVTLHNIEATDMLLALMGSGDDRLFFNNVTMGSGLIDGGAGNDRLGGTYTQQTDESKIRRSNFEESNLSRYSEPIVIISFD